VSEGRYWVKRLDELPLVPTDDPNDFDWYPIQHHLGLGAFGVNAFGGDAGTSFVHEHDETKASQEELYVVLRGAARFTLADDEFEAGAVSFVAIPDPTVRRAAVAVEDDTLLLAIGAPADSGFTTTWRAEHFEQVPRAE
jgi:mannose-6-phosphate isomerase-like protein (cupin superfamily)